MFLSARRRLRTALIVLCALLLAQWTLAAHACPVARLPSAPAPMHGERLPAVNAAHGCHDADDLERLAAVDDTAKTYVDATLCDQHCDDDGQASGAGTVAAIDAPAQTALRVALPAQHLPPAGATVPACGDATAPPLTILYCVFLT